MVDILNIGSVPFRDDTIIRKQYHSYTPYTTSFGNNDEIRIAIQSQDLYVLPSESYIILEFQVSRKTANAYAEVNGTWTSNFASYLFSEIRYELNGIEIDRTKNVGLTSNVKRFTAASKLRKSSLIHIHTGEPIELKTYSVIIPLDQVLGFCEDYRKIILNAKHELILIRNRQDIYTYMAESEAFDISVLKIQWKVPHIQLADKSKLMMLRFLEKRQSISVSYRSWDMYEMPQLPVCTKHIWTVKSATQMSKPRFVFVVFQTSKQLVSVNSASFDNCAISDVKLFLNSEYYPYDNFNSHFTNRNYQELYHTFLQIQSTYYNEAVESAPVSMTYEQFGLHPIFAFDCTRTDESLLGGTVDIRLEINARDNIPINTAAYCVIIHDNQIEYSPFSGIVVRNT